MTVKKKTHKIYIADDGKKFDDKDECEEYEAELKRKSSFSRLQAVVDKIECIELGEAPYSMYYVDDDKYEYRWYRPKTIEEVSALNDFFHIELEISEAVGEWVCIEIDGGYDYYSGEEDAFITNDLKCSNESIVNFYARLGYDVEIKKKPISVDIRDKAIEHLWEQFEDIPMNPKTECIEQPFFQFPAGSNKYEIWKWFDTQYSKGVASLVDGGCI